MMTVEEIKGVDASEAKSFTVRLPIDMLKVDRASYQRSLSRDKIKKMLRDGLDPDSIGIIFVSLRENGDYMVVDGQHRVEAARRAGWDSMECKVFLGKSLADEARQFVRSNVGHTKPDARDLFRGSIAAESPIAMEMKRIAEKNGYKIAENVGGGHYKDLNTINGVNTIEKLLTKYGSDALDEALSVIRQSWNDEEGATNSRVIEGVHTFLLRHKDDNVDISRLVKSLSCDRPLKLVNDARNLSVYSSGWLTSMYEVMLTKYNFRLRTNILRKRPSPGEESVRKLTEVQVQTIRGRILAGESQQSIAKEYGVDKSTISLIAVGKTWTWLESNTGI